MPFQSTKKYGHNVGLSCAFRQWRADSHCKFLHGYALAFEFTFESDELDVRNWVADFGGMKSLKAVLENAFDHKTVVAEDDPEIEWFREGHRRGILELHEVPAGGCEMFAQMAYKVAEQWLFDAGYGQRVRLVKAQVWEHES